MQLRQWLLRLREVRNPGFKKIRLSVGFIDVVKLPNREKVQNSKILGLDYPWFFEKHRMSHSRPGAAATEPECVSLHVPTMNPQKTSHETNVSRRRERVSQS